MPKIRTFNITCPECDTILVINRDTGDIVEVRKPLVEDSSGDRFTDALRAHKEHTEKLGSIFKDSISDVSRQEEERRKVFKESLEKAREEGVDDYKELRDIDLD
jgi:hypothetical protein